MADEHHLLKIETLGASLEASEDARDDYQTLFEMTPEIMVVANKSVFLRVNPAFTKATGYAPDEVVGRRWREFVHPDDLERTDAAARAVFERQFALHKFRNRLARKDGGFVAVSWTASQPDSSGKVYSVGRTTDG